MNVLTANALSAGYGSMIVVKDVDLEVGPGELVALLGPNGAGKSTTLATLAGIIKPATGHVEFLGESTTARLHQRARAGLAYLPERRAVFSGLTTAANLRLGQGDPREVVGFFPELERLGTRPAGLLSGGEQQMVAVGRVLAAHPKVLLADELSFGLAPLVVERIFRGIREAVREGMGALVVEQHTHQALAYADRVYVMGRGRIVASGTADDIRGRWDEIRSAYVSKAAVQVPGSTLIERRSDHD